MLCGKCMPASGDSCMTNSVSPVKHQKSCRHAALHTCGNVMQSTSAVDKKKKTHLWKQHRAVGAVWWVQQVLAWGWGVLAGWDQQWWWGCGWVRAQQ